MPRRRRPTNTPQGAPRKRRPVRRPEFAPEPEAESDLDGKPIFADETVNASATGFFGSSGPVETRPHWIQQEERRQGRRMSQLRRSTRDDMPVTRTGGAGQLPVFQRRYILNELRLVSITTGALLALLIVLTFILR